MKYIIFTLFFFFLVEIYSRQVPKGYDLDNHFGYSPYDSPYGNKRTHLRIRVEPEPEYEDAAVVGYDGELTPVKVMKTKLVNPEIAKPKIHVVSKHRGTVRKTNFVGHQEDHHVTRTLDSFGNVVDNEYVERTPIFETVDEPFEVEKHHYINLDGTKEPPTVIKYHGIGH